MHATACCKGFRLAAFACDLVQLFIQKQVQNNTLSTQLSDLESGGRSLKQSVKSGNVTLVRNRPVKYTSLCSRCQQPLSCLFAHECATDCTCLLLYISRASVLCKVTGLE